MALAHGTPAGVRGLRTRCRELRLQHLDVIDPDRLREMAARFGSPKVARFARNVIALAAAQGEEYEEL